MSDRTLTCHRALDIDDILEAILQHALRPTVEDLLFQTPDIFPFPDFSPLSRHAGSVVRVSRRWYRIGRQTVRRFASLDPDISYFIRPRLPNPLYHVSQLHYIFPSQSTDAFDDFLDLLRRVAGMNPASAFTSGPRIREIALSEVPSATMVVDALLSTRLCEHVTLLMASAGFYEPPFPWDSVLDLLGESNNPAESMPRLKHLFLSHGHLDRLNARWLAHSGIQLTSLCLDRVIVRNDSTLQSLLLGIASPSLEYLSMLQVRCCLLSTFDKYFLDRWAPLCCNLRWIQLSARSYAFSLLNILAVSLTQAHRIECFDVLPTEKHLMIAFSRKPAVLEVSGIATSKYEKSTLPHLVHDFLCSPIAVGLQGVILPGLTYDTMVLNRSRNCRPSVKKFVDTSAWSPSSLTTLVLTVACGQSKTMCGFIAVSAPCLRLLDLRLRGSNAIMGPKDGLCFLGRLSKLEHLTIRWHATGGPHDVSASNRGDGSVELRKRQVDSHKSRDLSFLRWMAIEPTESDREEGLTNLAQCRHVLSTTMTSSPSMTMLHLNTVVPPLWGDQLKAMLEHGHVGQMLDGSCWQQLKTFQGLILQSVQIIPECIAAAKHYEDAIQDVLPDVKVSVCWVSAFDNDYLAPRGRSSFPSACF